MKKLFKPTYIPLLALVAGAVGALLRFWLQSTGFDEKGLLIPGHPAEIICYILTGLVLAAIFLCLMPLSGKQPYTGFFPASAISALGYWIAAAGILCTTLAERSTSGAPLELLCTVFGVLSGIGLFYAGLCRLRGTRPISFAHSIFAIYLTLRLVCQYRLWNSETQVTVFFFQLLSIVFLAFTALHFAALDADQGQARSAGFFCFGALFFCCTSLGDARSLFFITMTLWLILSGCRFNYRPIADSMQLPEDVSYCIEQLSKNGFDAYAVGGCVRDALLGLTPQDYDLCTDATPAEIAAVFSEYQLVRSGEKHGTIGVVLNGQVYEITTFRTEGGYTDSRHPDWVNFVKDVRADLARRDFTVNAMAYSPAKGLIDPFGGRLDLQERILRTVGDPGERFTEDALRILRGVRFASRYRLTPHPETKDAMFELADTLDTLAHERIFTELSKLLTYATADDLIVYAPILTQVIPELKPCVNFDQKTPHHKYDIYTHTAYVVEATEPELSLRFAALLHDIGKPAKFTVDEKGCGHFYKHAEESAALADLVLQRLRAPNALRQQVVTLIANHMDPLSADKQLLRRRLSKFGEQTLRQLVSLQKADRIGTGTDRDDTDYEAIEKIIAGILEENACLKVTDLAVDGNDLMAAGFTPGPRLGQVLETLLEMVLQEQTVNEKDALLAAAEKIKEETP